MYPSQLHVTGSSSKDSVNKSCTCTDRLSYRREKLSWAYYSECYAKYSLDSPQHAAQWSAHQCSWLMTFPHTDHRSLYQIFKMNAVLNSLLNTLPFCIFFTAILLWIAATHLNRSSDLIVDTMHSNWATAYCASVLLSKLETRAR